MTAFVPRGYLTLRQALDRVAQSLFGNEWQGTILSDGEQTALVKQAQATKLMRVYSTTGRAAQRLPHPRESGNIDTFGLNRAVAPDLLCDARAERGSPLPCRWSCFKALPIDLGRKRDEAGGLVGRARSTAVRGGSRQAAGYSRAASILLLRSGQRSARRSRASPVWQAASTASMTRPRARRIMCGVHIDPQGGTTMIAMIATARISALSLAATAGLIFAHTAPAAAEEQTLQFKLVTQQVGVPSALPEVGGHKITVGQYMGVAIFEDARIAHKRFVDVSDDTAEAGSFKGYSTYTFEDGDALTLSYTGGWNADGVAGTYEVISGTGNFAGATGTGSFKAEDEPWDEAMLLEVSLDLTLVTQ